MMGPGSHIRTGLYLTAHGMTAGELAGLSAALVEPQLAFRA